jgi:hypothetical protein
MFNVFAWIRSGVRQAVLAGLADAVSDVTATRVEDGDVRLSRLLSPSAPVDVTTPAADDLLAPGGNGKGSRKVKARN